jgi:hypothetical protein
MKPVHNVLPGKLNLLSKELIDIGPVDFLDIEISGLFIVHRHLPDITGKHKNPLSLLLKISFIKQIHEFSKKVKPHERENLNNLNSKSVFKNSFY